MRKAIIMAKLKSGDILQIPLPKGLGFAYAKYVNLLEINANYSYSCLIRVYNKRFINSEISINDLEKQELLLSPLLIGGVPPSISKGMWKIVGNLPLTDEEKLIPHYKRKDPLINLNEKNISGWYYIIDADISQKIPSTYEQVKHLEKIGATGALLVGTKIAMAFLLDEGKNIEDYFELKEYFEKVYFEEVTQIEVYYKQPKYMRGKALVH